MFYSPKTPITLCYKHAGGTRTSASPRVQPHTWAQGRWGHCKRAVGPRGRNHCAVPPCLAVHWAVIVSSDTDLSSAKSASPKLRFSKVLEHVCNWYRVPLKTCVKPDRVLPMNHQHSNALSEQQPLPGPVSFSHQWHKEPGEHGTAQLPQSTAPWDPLGAGNTKASPSTTQVSLEENQETLSFLVLWFQKHF